MMEAKTSRQLTIGDRRLVLGSRDQYWPRSICSFNLIDHTVIPLGAYGQISANHRTAARFGDRLYFTATSKKKKSESSMH
jgi:hypothetical protein